MRKIIARVCCLILLCTVLMPLPVEVAHAEGGKNISIDIYPGAPDLSEFVENLSKNEKLEYSPRYFSTYFETYQGEDSWKNIYDSVATYDHVLKGIPMPGAEKTELERISITWPYGTGSYRYSEKFTCEDPNKNLNENDATIRQVVTTTYRFDSYGYSKWNEYLDKLKKKTDIELSEIQLEGYQTYLSHKWDETINGNADKKEICMKEPYLYPGKSEWKYDVVVVPPGKADVVVVLGIQSTVEIYKIYRYGNTDVDQSEERWSAASKALYESETKPALDAQLAKVFNEAELKVKRTKLYDGEFVFGGEPAVEEKKQEEDNKKTDYVVDKPAEENPGEDDGTFIPSDIFKKIPIVPGAVAVIGAVGAASGDPDSEKKKKAKEKSAYKMLETAASGEAKVLADLNLSPKAKQMLEAYGLLEEGIYQPAKYSDKIISKDWLMLKNGHPETLSSNDYLFNRLGERATGLGRANDAIRGLEQTGTRVSITDTRKVLQMRGTSVEEMIERMGDNFEKLDKLAGASQDAAISDAMSNVKSAWDLVMAVKSDNQKGKKDS